MITQKISVPLDANPPYERVKMHYGDSGRTLEVAMLFNGQPFTPSSEDVATFQAKKPDKTVVTRTSGVTISGNTVTIVIPENVLAIPGIVYCECLISNGNETVGTMRWEIEVMEPAVMLGDIESSDDFQSVVAATARAEAAANSAEQSAETAQNAELHPVIVGANGNYWNWDGTAGAYADSGVEAQGGPQGEPGPAGEDAIAVNIQSGEYREPGSTKPLPDLPAFADTNEYDAYLVDDDAIDGQYDLYIHGAGGTDWMIIDNWAGVPGPAGADGKVQSIVAGTGIQVNNANPANPVISGNAIELFNLIKAMALDAAHPIGDIYMSANDVNPETLFGGTWVAWGAGRVPVGVDSTQTEFNAVEKTGGAKTTTLQKTNLPNVRITVSAPVNIPQTGGDIWQVQSLGTVQSASAFFSPLGYSEPLGDGTPLGALPPYITCYMWKRTA